MKKRARKRESAIVPAIIFSASLACGVCAIPTVIVGCNQATGLPNGMEPGLGLDVAARGFDVARPPVGLDVAALDFAIPLSVADIGFDGGGEG